MRREDAVKISDEEMIKLNYVDDVINYLIECYKNGVNVYCVYNDVMLYSCDGYTYDEYYILAMGLSLKDKNHLDELVFGEGRTQDDLMKITELILPVFSYLREMYMPLREELKNGKKNKQIK